MTSIPESVKQAIKTFKEKKWSLGPSERHLTTSNTSPVFKKHKYSTDTLKLISINKPSKNRKTTLNPEVSKFSHKTKFDLEKSLKMIEVANKNAMNLPFTGIIAKQKKENLPLNKKNEDIFFRSQVKTVDSKIEDKLELFLETPITYIMSKNAVKLFKMNVIEVNKRRIHFSKINRIANNLI